MKSEEWISESLKRLREQHLDRHIHHYTEAGGKIRVGDQRVLNFSSNDYLALARSPSVAEEAENALRRWGTGAAASRLVTGTLTCHEELEQRLACYKGYPSAVVFGSGYMANIGVIPALVGRGDLVVADKRVHASIIDAAILSRAVFHRFQHNDVDHLSDILKKKPSSAQCLVITESVFSMDGDLAPVKDIVAAVQRYGAMLMVDEAHATGVFGPKGAGLVRQQGLEHAVNVSMGTLSKAFGGYGGFVACSNHLRDLLVNRARSFIFSTAIPPPVVGAALGALSQIEANPEWGADLLSRAERFREQLRDAGLDTGQSASQIIPVIVGDNHKALAFSGRLKDRGILAIAIRPPTVPLGTARIRLSVTLDHSVEDLERAAKLIAQAAVEENIL